MCYSFQGHTLNYWNVTIDLLAAGKCGAYFNDFIFCLCISLPQMMYQNVFIS